jgi:hypothetical protein
LLEPRSGSGEGIDCRRLHRASIGSDILIAEVIGEENHHIGLFSIRSVIGPNEAERDDQKRKGKGDLKRTTHRSRFHAFLYLSPAPSRNRIGIPFLLM